MKKFTPQLILIGLICLFLVIFLLPQFSISLNYRAYKWEVESLDRDGKQVTNQINLITTNPRNVDYRNLKRSIEVKPGTIDWLGLEFSLLGMQSELANFGKGAGIYPSFTYTYKASAREEGFFKRDVILVRSRLDATGFKDVEVTKIKKEKEWQIVLSFPAYYTKDQSQRVADLIMSPGKLAIFEADTTPDTGTDKDKDDKKKKKPEPKPTVAETIYKQLLPGFKPKSTQLDISDLAGIQVVNRTEYVRAVWEVTFKEESRQVVYATLRRLGIEPDLQQNTAGGANPYAGIPVFSFEFDGLPQIALIYQGDLKFIGLPLGLISTEEELRATSSYFVSSSLLASGYSRTDAGTAKNIYASQGRTLLAWFIVLTFVAIAYSTFRKSKLTGVLAGTLAIALPTLAGLGLAKFVATPISIGFILSVMFALALSAVYVHFIINGPESELNYRLRLYREASLLIFLLCGVLYLSTLGFGIFHEILGVVGLMAIAGYIATWVGLKQILNWFFE